MDKQNRFRQLLLLGALLLLPLTASARPEMSYGLALNGDLWGNPFTSGFQFDDDFSLSSMNMNLSGPFLKARAGDISANWDQLGLAGRSFQGISTEFAVGKADVALLGGSVILRPDILQRQLSDLLEPVPEPIVSPIYGVRAALPLGNKFNLSASQLMAPNAPDAQGKGISTMGLHYRPSARQHLSLETARSRQGSGWQLSGETKSNKLALQASYRQAEPGFSTAGNPSLLTRRNGGFINLNYRLAPTLSLKANSQRYNDGMEGQFNYDSLTLRYAKRKKPTVSVFWRAMASEGLSYKGTNSSHAAQGMGFRVSHLLKANQVSFQYDRLQSSSTGITATNKSTDRFSLGLSRPLGQNTQLSLFQILDLGQNIQTGATDRTRYTSLGLRHRLNQSGLTANVGVQYVNRSADANAGQQTSMRAGISYPVGTGSSIDLQYQTSIAGSGSLSARGADQLYIGYSHRFNSSSRSTQNLSLQQRRQLGRVTGRVFEDKNGNGQWDDGEPGVPDVAVITLNGLSQQTDEGGRFSMREVRPGNHEFRLETKTLPIEYTALNSGNMLLQVVADKSAALDIPVVRTGQAKGIVFWDTNRNGLRDEGETVAGNVVVQVEGSDMISFTDEGGSFTLHNLPPRSWKMAVNVSILGEAYENTGSGFAQASVPSNGVVNDILLGIAEKERAIINTLEKAAL